MMHVWNFAKQLLGGTTSSALPKIAPAPERLTPSFLLIGAQRCGTTSLYWYLSEHPQILPAAQKEVHYFDLFYARGAAWYAAQFPRISDLPVRETFSRADWITGEASPYYLFHPLAAERAFAALPQAKLLLMLRNPIDRAQSHHQHETRLGNETLDFAAALAAEDDRLRGQRELLRAEPDAHSQALQSFSYRARGCYADQIEQWLRFYSREQMHVVISEDFYADPSAALEKITDFLGLSAFEERAPQAFEKHNLAAYQPMNPATRAALREFFRPHNARLEKLLGRQLAWDR